MPVSAKDGETRKKKKDRDGKRERRNKKRKMMKRCTSPSHFVVNPAEETSFGPPFTLHLPARDHVDNLLRAVANMYYTPKETHANGNSVWVSQDYDYLTYPSLDLLISPLRKPSPLDMWSPREIALFEAGICKVGKDFHKIQKLIETKTVSELVEFYYLCWKKSSHYQLWKTNERQKQPEVPATSGSASTRFLRSRQATSRSTTEESAAILAPTTR